MTENEPHEQIPQGFIKIVDREGNLVQTIMASVEPLMETLPREILEAIQNNVLEKYPDCSVIIK